MIGSSKASAMEDMSNPFYLHNGDYPRLILSRVMAMTLTTKTKIGFVDGIVPCVAPTDFLFNAWNHCNNMVTLWILNSISKDIIDSLMYIAIAIETGPICAIVFDE
ncbi:hypothetical protein AAG906_022864 [Vitis piasezkii]